MSNFVFDQFDSSGLKPLGFAACSPSCNPAPAESLAAPAAVQSRASILTNDAQPVCTIACMSMAR